MPDKLRHIYFPYLAVAVLVGAGYSVLRYLLDVQLDILPLKHDVLNFWIPIMLAFTCVFAFLRRRIRLLQLNTSGGKSPYALYILIAGAGICIPTIVMQEYIDTAAYGLIKVRGVSEIDPAHASRYYALGNFYADKVEASFYSTSATSGKRNQNLTFTMYIAIPAYDSVLLQTSPRNSYWFGVEYSKTISHPGSDGEQAAYTAFCEDVERQFAASSL